MASIIDEIFTGIVPFANNQALEGLAKIFGKKLLNEGSDVGSLVMLSAALNPVYLGLLFIILAYIGIGGVVRTAMEGTFLGRQWNSFGVPAMFMACVVLLSPVPTRGSATLGQVIFVKTVVFGSNFADYVLKTTFTLAGQQAYVKESYSLIPQYIPGVNNQMRGAFLTYYCARQITQMGYGSKTEYFVLLNKVCGVPADMTGLYADYYALDAAKGNVRAIQERLNQFRTNDMDVPTFSGYSVGRIVTAAQNLSATSKQMSCHFQQFDTSFGEPALNAVRMAGNITPVPGIGKITPTSTTESVPTQVNSRLLQLNEPAIVGMWSKALFDSYGCMRSQVYQGRLAEESQASTSPAANRDPWRLGWTNAALAISEELEDYKSSQSGMTIPLSIEVVKRPNPELLGETLLDKKNRTLLNDELLKLDQLLTGPNNPIDKSQEIVMDITSKGFVASTADWGRAATTIFFANGVSNANEALSQAAAANLKVANRELITLADQASIKKGERIEKFMNTLVGKSSSASAVGLGKTTSLAAKTILFIYNKAMLLLKIDKAADKLSNIPIVGWVASATNAAATMLAPGPAVMEALSYLLVAMNAIVLLPQLVLLVVMLIWMVKAAVWFMIIPLATVLIALPNTRVGHDIWKSALAIALTPMLALLFFLVSLTITDMMYTQVMYWVFQPIIYKWDSGSGIGAVGSASLEFVMQIFTGELLFRVLLGLALAGATTVYLTMLVLRGPDLVCRSLGLSSSSGDLGEGFDEMRGGIRGKLAGAMGKGG